MDDQKFSFIFVKFQIVVCHPSMDFRAAFIDDFLRRYHRRWRFRVDGDVKLRVICKEVVVHAAALNDGAQWSCIKSEQNGPQDGALRHTVVKI